MALSIAHAQGTVADIVANLKERLSTSEPKLLVYFASSRLPPDELSAAIHAAFAGTPAIGCTTAGEITSGKMLQGSVVAMLLGSEHLRDARVALVPDVHAEGGVRQALDSLSSHFGKPAGQLDPNELVGLVFIDGLSGGEEKVMAALGSATNVVFVGGSAGDDLAFERTYVMHGGKAYQGAALLALLAPSVPFQVLKTQSFRATDKRLLVTEADEATRTVHQFNGRPAAHAYAEALGVPLQELSEHFMTNPLGLMVNEGEPFVRSPMQVQGESVKFYCEIKKGMELALLESGDIVVETSHALAQKRAQMGSVSGLINFHCILRTLELRNKEQEGAYGALFSDVPTVGFSTYGEEYIGHINQTSTMLLFGSKG